MAESAQELQGPPDRRMPGRPAQYTYTDAERKALKECADESTWYRAIPLGGAGAGLAYFLVKQGKLTASVRYGPLPKMCYAAFFGYMIGKISYLSVCRAKILALENSPLADAIRSKTKFNTLRREPQLSDEEPEYSPKSPVSFRSRDIGDMPMSSPDAYTSNDIDVTKEVVSRKDADTVSAFAPLAPMEDETKKAVTYSELRQKHRSEQRHMTAPTGFVPPTSYNSRASPQTPSESIYTANVEQSRQRHFGQQFNPDAHFGKKVGKSQTVNQYGDIIDDDE